MDSNSPAPTSKRSTISVVVKASAALIIALAVLVGIVAALGVGPRTAAATPPGNPSYTIRPETGGSCPAGSRAINFTNNCSFDVYIGESIGQPQVDGTPNCTAQSDCTNGTVNATVKCVAPNNGHNMGTTSGKCTITCAQDSDCGPEQICNLGNNGGTAGNSNYLVNSSTAVGVCYFANYEPSPVSSPTPASNWQLSANGGQAQMCLPEATPIPGGFPEGHSCTQHSDCGSFNCYDTTLAQQCTPGDANCKCGALFTWSGNFWGRTNCSLASGQLTCDTGNCGGANGTAQRVDCNGNSSLTVQGPQNPQNLAEYTLLSPAYGTGVQDNYDNSMVNGFNVGMAAAPVTGTFSGTPAKGYCSSPGQGCSFDLLSTCPDVLKYENGSSTVVGCWSPAQVCEQGTGSQQTALGCNSQVPFLCTAASDCPYNAAGTFQTMTCNISGGQAFGQCQCSTTADCPSGFTCSSSVCTTSSGANWADLYGCQNFYNLSPYNVDTTTNKDVGIICGCPTWSSPPSECITHNVNWEQVPSGSTSPVASPAPTTSANDLYLIFHNACATAYTYAYDDNSGTVGCAPASGAQVGPSYNITYCPQSTGPTATATPTSTPTGGATPTATPTGGGTPTATPTSSTPTATPTSSVGPTGTPTTGPTPTVTATATPQPSGVATPISEGSGTFAPGATADLGSFGYTSTSMNPQVINSVSLSISKPKIFSSITVTASIGGTQVGTATVSSPDIDKTTIFTFEEPIDVAAGASVTFAISGVISGGGSGQLDLQRQVRLAGIIPAGDHGGLGGTGRLMLALSLMGLVIAPLTSSKRRRNTAILAAVMMVLATGMVGCGSSSSSSSSTSGTSKQDVVAMSVTELGNEIDVAGIPISLGQVTKQ